MVIIADEVPLPSLLGKERKSISSQENLQSSCSKSEICTSPAVCPVCSTRKYRKIPDLKEQILKRLPFGTPSPIICKQLCISRSLEKYHRDKALEKGIIKKASKQRPFIYEKGPNFLLLSNKNARGRRSREFVQPYCRVHAPKGDHLIIKAIKIGDINRIKTDDGIFPLFTDAPVKQGEEDRYRTNFAIPFEIIGYQGAQAVMDFRYRNNSGLLLISPPELHSYALDLGVLQPFQGILDYLAKLLSKHAGWVLSEPYWDGKLHFAFLEEAVQQLSPDLLNGITKLKRGQEEEDLLIYKDNSHGCPELETTVLRVAVDILAMLTVAIYQRTGKR